MQRCIVLIAAIIVAAGSLLAQTTMTKHIVERGETLESIAQHYKVTTAKIIEHNPQASQFIYVGMELLIPVDMQGQVSQPEQNGLQRSSSESAAKHSDNAGASSNILFAASPRTASSVTTISEYPKGRFGVNLHGYFEADLVKYGSNVSFEGLIKGDNSPFGVDFSMGWNVFWKPKFDVSSCVFGLGPFWCTKLSDDVDFYVPVKLICVATMDDNDKWHTDWGCRINPLVCIHAFSCGVFADIAKEASFGISFGFLW